MLGEHNNDRTNRTRHQLRASGAKHEGPNPLRSGVHSRGYLPHVKREGSEYFVTFRLADSLPQVVLRKLKAEQALRLRRLAEDPTAQDTEDEIQRDLRRRIERYLDRGAGECWLGKPEIADIVHQALQHFDNERYSLRAWVVMPNHVHVVVWPHPNHTLSRILQSWKSFTALEANKSLNRTGARFWQPESYDHWIRNDDERARIVRYVINNPVKAGLCATPKDWPWSGPEPLKRQA